MLWLSIPGPSGLNRTGISLIGAVIGQNYLTNVPEMTPM